MSEVLGRAGTLTGGQVGLSVAVDDLRAARPGS
jgi:hypothetical protein